MCCQNKQAQHWNRPNINNLPVLKHRIYLGILNTDFNINITVFWDLLLYSVVDTVVTNIVQVAGSLETLVPSYQMTQCHIPGVF
jgi:hypothetical protein